MAVCEHCGHDNDAGAKFCNGCGASLTQPCSACGSTNPPGARFCNECGAALSGATAPVQAGANSADQPSERRLVSVLFADLVGFTTLSESRDAEEVRELLSRYFDTCRRLIELYGGTVEKFIGDAVMAVWGTPVATEDDAERAVRAALDLVAAVSALGAGGRRRGPAGARRGADRRGRREPRRGRRGHGRRRPRQHRLAGAVGRRARQRARRRGDAAGDASRRSSTRSAGTFELKGKEGTTQLWTALRVVSGVGGQLKSQGLEAPFVGRDRELRQIKDLFHVCAEERQGAAGLGDRDRRDRQVAPGLGVLQVLRRHRADRLLAPGPLPRLRRRRHVLGARGHGADALPDRRGRASRARRSRKLDAALEEHILDPERAPFVEPRLAQLLGLGEHETRERQDLFAAWRLFFERLAETLPDGARLRGHAVGRRVAARLRRVPARVVAEPPAVRDHARPPGAARAAADLGRRTPQLHLPLPGAALGGGDGGAPRRARPRAAGRACATRSSPARRASRCTRSRRYACCSTAGCSSQEGPSTGSSGEIESLEVPETLHALIAARLDGLSRDERRLFGDAAVLGKTFTPAALAALTRNRASGSSSALLGGLVRKEVLGLQSDPRSPEHGQYGFLQDLLRHVAYETLPKRERRDEAPRSRRAPVSGASSEDEVAEVVASHLLEAYRLDPDADDAAHRVTKAQRGARPRGRARGLARRLDRSAALLRAGRRPRAPTGDAGVSALPRRRDGDARRLDRSGRRTFRAGDRAVRIGRRHARGRAGPELAGLVGTERRKARRRQSSGWSARTRSSPATRPTATSRSAPRLGQAALLRRAPGAGAGWIEQGLDVAEALQLPEHARARLVGQGRRHRRPASRGSARPDPAGARDGALPMTSTARRGDVCESRRPRLPAGSLLRFARGSTELLEFARRTATGETSGSRSARRPTRDHARTLGRGVGTAGRVPDDTLGRIATLSRPSRGCSRSTLSRGDLDEARAAARPVRRSRSVRRRPGALRLRRRHRRRASRRRQRRRGARQSGAGVRCRLGARDRASRMSRSDSSVASKPRSRSATRPRRTSC